MPDSHAARYEGAFSGRRCLVTGGAGFIGSHLARRLVDLGAHVVVLDNLASGHQHNLPGEHLQSGRIELIEASILDEPALARAVHACALVFHQAAMVSVPQSVAQPGECMMVNVVGTQRVLSAAARAGVQRVMFAASAAAYGNTPSLPSRESDLPDSWSPYAASKISGELLLQTFARCASLSTVSLRYFNVFGPRQDPGSAYSGVISLFIKWLVAGEPPTIHGDGEQTRDFTYVANVVDGVLRACEVPAASGEAINVATGGRISLNELLRVLQGIVGTDLAAVYGPSRVGDVRDSQASIEKAERLLGYAPTVAFEDGLRRTVEWFRAA